jgi:hypothetical protein
MKKFIFATVSGLALSLSYAAVAKDAVTTQAVPAKQGEMMKVVPAPKSAAVHHHKHHKHHGHHRHHGHHVESMGGPAAKVEGIYVAFPPLSDCGEPTCIPSYYAGNPECPYQYHEGYFWYPQAKGDVLVGYSPYYHQGLYWYASHMHPHMVYVEKKGLVFVEPYPLHAPHAMDKTLHDMQASPMEVKFTGAPVERPAVAE